MSSCLILGLDLCFTYGNLYFWFTQQHLNGLKRKNHSLIRSCNYRYAFSRYLSSAGSHGTKII